jgi:predicted acylesterase/phospholipase RssA
MLVLCFALLLPTGAAWGQSETFSSGAPRADTVSALFTISGGISLGSYQAGVNWGLLEVMKLTSRDPLRAMTWGLPQYELRAMAGASAGNINGFLTAIEWCRTREPIAPEESLFWKSWVQTGFDQLFALQRYDDRDAPSDALLSRRYFDVVLFDTLRASMSDLPASGSPPGCRVPVGVTVTRIRPQPISIADDLVAETQRYASVVVLSGERSNTLEFLPPSELGDTRKLGALLLLPPGPDGAIGIDTVFSVVQASSAFPGAFAPVRLEYVDSTAACDERPDRPCTSTALFSDGGVFDNNPIDLAAGLYNEFFWKNEERADSSVIMVFIDPDALRGRLRETRNEEVRPPASGGIAALVDLFTGAIPAARQYELQSFGRLLERAPEIFVQENIKVTKRAFPIVGEQLGAFAAFLGKPFREYDFYVGIYDALSFFAERACDGNTGIDSLCVRERLAQFVETEDLDFGGSSSSDGDTPSLARKVLRALYGWEHQGAAPATVFRFDPAAPPREVLVLALLRAHSLLVERFDNEKQCRSSGDGIDTGLCLNGFRLMLDDFANDTVLHAIDRALAHQPDTVCSPSNWIESPVRCDADESFEWFVRNPSRFAATKTGLLLHQAWRVELARKKAGEKHWAGVATLSEFVFQSGIGYRYRRGYDFNTSSIPRGSGRQLFAAIIPNYVSFNLESSGFELGYRPRLHLSNHWAVGLTSVPLHVIRDAGSSLDTYRWVVGPTLHWKRASTLLSGVETGVELFGRWRRSPFGDEADRVWAIPLTAYLLADKFRVGLRFLPGNDSQVHDGSKFAVSLGVSDVNGLVYWMFRIFKTL